MQLERGGMIVITAAQVRAAAMSCKRALDVGMRWRGTQQSLFRPVCPAPLPCAVGARAWSSARGAGAPVMPASSTWSGRALGAVLVAAGAGALVERRRAHARDAVVNVRDAAVAGPVLNAVSEAASQCIPDKHRDLDQDKASAAFDALRQQRGAKKGADVLLSAEDFRLIMTVVSTQRHESRLAALFAALDPHGTGTVSMIKCEAAIAALASGTGTQDSNRKFLFDFFDVAGKGTLSRDNVESGLMRLVNVALAHTDGRFVELVQTKTPGQPDLSAEDVCAAVATTIFTDICGAAAPKPITKKAFEDWMCGDSASNKAVVRLFMTMGVALAGEPTWDASRYGGYAFLTARLSKLAAAKARYLAFSSDVGEAVRPAVPVWLVNATYAIAFAYVSFDIANVGYKESKKGEEGNVPRAVAFQTIFQGLASIGLPYVIIHTAVHQSQKFCLKRAPRFAVIIPSMIGLAIIPLLPSVCDEPVEHLLEEAFDYAWPHNDATPHAKSH